MPHLESYAVVNGRGHKAALWWLVLLSGPALRSCGVGFGPNFRSAGRLLQKAKWLAATIILTAVMVSTRVAAGDTNELIHAPQFVPVAFQAAVKNGEIVGVRQIRRVFMTSGSRRMMFVLPEGFRADISNPEKIVLVGADHNCLLSFRILTQREGNEVGVNADSWRAWVTAQLTDPIITNEHSFSVANNTGPAFDLVCKVDRVQRATRIGYVSSPVGVLEFSALCGPEQFEAAKSTLYILMRGFRISDADGQLQVRIFTGEN